MLAGPKDMYIVHDKKPYVVLNFVKVKEQKKRKEQSEIVIILWGKKIIACLEELQISQPTNNHSQDENNISWLKIL